MKPIAIYLPQFHPIKENNEWWGKGFTEWTNVTKAVPLFKGHYQPHLPADLGFYDLRIPEVREEQAAMAKNYGIHGFCYYHYWFNGRRIMERPFQEIIESGKPDFPFMLCWANENWTRVWDGSEKNILLEQKYSDDDDRAHIQHLLPYFQDKRYIRIDDKPVIAIYKSVLLPSAQRTVKIWREEAAKAGLELYICRFENFSHIGESYLRDGGFDAAIDFQPFGNFLDAFRAKKNAQFQRSLAARISYKAQRTFVKMISHEKYSSMVHAKAHVLDYNEYVDFVKTQPFPTYSWFPGITPMWDNSARKKNYFMFHHSSPEKYGEWLKHIKDNFRFKDEKHNFVFINAWNEWAEGNHLEPDRKWGLRYLETTKQVLDT
ncbi:MAG: glycoside hydrolase family 99-like domain-containing protein [Chitinophagaceae bacterium]